MSGSNVETAVDRDLLPLGTYHSPGDLEKKVDAELDAAQSTIRNYVALVCPKVVNLEIFGMGYVDDPAHCNKLLAEMQRDQVIAIANRLPSM